jgi:hypothetical protein
MGIFRGRCARFDGVVTSIKTEIPRKSHLPDQVETAAIQAPPAAATVAAAAAW